MENLPKNLDPQRVFLAADLGGTNIRVGLLRADGSVLASNGFRTNPQKGPEAILERLTQSLKKLLGMAPGAAPAALGLGLPGVLQPKDGLLVQAPNLPGWHNLPIADILTEKLEGLPVFIENDANLFALGEYVFGAAQGLKNFLGITIGTGVGGGLILEGRIWQGSFGTAGEFGHVPLEKGGKLCGCGAYGCLETVASASAMAREAVVWLKSGRETSYSGSPEALDSELLSELALKNDPMALEVFKQAGEALGLGMVGVLNLLGLEGFVFGGGGSGALRFLKPHMLKELRKRSFLVDPQRILITSAALGHDGPLLGALALMLQKGR